MFNINMTKYLMNHWKLLMNVTNSTSSLFLEIKVINKQERWLSRKLSKTLNPKTWKRIIFLLQQQNFKNKRKKLLKDIWFHYNKGKVSCWTSDLFHTKIAYLRVFSWFPFFLTFCFIFTVLRSRVFFNKKKSLRLNVDGKF